MGTWWLVSWWLVSLVAGKLVPGRFSVVLVDGELAYWAGRGMKLLGSSEHGLDVVAKTAGWLSW